MSKIIKITNTAQHQDAINKAAGIIKSGGIVIFPTTCLYGIAADPFNSEAVNTLFRIKLREKSKPVSLLISNNNDLYQLTENISHSGLQIMNKFWPGKITIVFKSSRKVPVSVTAGTGKIGLRIPEHPIAFGIIKKTAIPVTATSANISGEPGASCIDDISPSLVKSVDLILDAGYLKKGQGTTIIDTTVVPPVVLRQGTVPLSDLLSLDLQFSVN